MKEQNIIKSKMNKNHLFIIFKYRSINRDYLYLLGRREFEEKI